MTDIRCEFQVACFFFLLISDDFTSESDHDP